MSTGQDVDRNEQATPYKLEEARKRGSVAKSRDLASLGVLAVATASLLAMSDSAVSGMARLLANGLAGSATAASSAHGAGRWMSGLLMESLQVLAPLMAATAVVVVVLNLLSSGVVLTTKPLQPDWSRLNPVAGLKRFLSIKLFYEAVKSTLMLAAMVLVGFLALKTLFGGAPRLFSLPPKAFLFVLLDEAGGLLAKLCAVIALFAVVDLVFSRWEFLRTLRMSRREIEDEHKHRDGDPRIKNRLRELRLEFLKRARSTSRVAEADVLITNPTHVAVALRYQHGTSPAPEVLAKGAGSMVRRMKDVAYRNGVPVVQNPPLARALFKEAATDAYVPERWYPQVAKILVWVQSTRALKLARPGASEGAA